MNNEVVTASFWFLFSLKAMAHVKKNRNSPHTLLGPHSFCPSSGINRSHEPFRFDQIWEGTKPPSLPPFLPSSLPSSLPPSLSPSLEPSLPPLPLPLPMPPSLRLPLHTLPLPLTLPF
jgi:hypothetical protein